ncbi:MAG: PA14 domain-containing protein, partial [Solirubrobacteraceae bacterium]|nr:PA14 domain-containing protein [Solirubrobacteraceae bacterium]
LAASYFNNATLAGSPALTRTEAVNFDWGTNAPAPGIVADNFSVRWSGSVGALAGGTYRFQTYSDDGVRVWINGMLVIDNWTDHSAVANTSGTITLAPGQRVSVRMEYYERIRGAVAQLRWLPPGGGIYTVIPAERLAPD